MGLNYINSLAKSSLMLVALALTGCGLIYPEPFPILHTVEDESVVLIHGLGRGAANMRQLKIRLEIQGYEVCNIDYATIGKGVDSMVEETSEKIDECILSERKVHFVGHSLGGLVIRSYLADHPSVVANDNLGYVVTLGTPHHGSEVADKFDGSVLIEVAGGVSQSLVTGDRSLGNQLPPPNYSLGAIAGTNSNFTTDRYFDGVNDGLVSLESSQISGMQDFIALDVTHIDMPYDPDVAYQTMHFLQTGQFDHLNNRAY